MPHYAIRHVTRFTYTTPVSESLMEVRMQPRSEGAQRCLRFELGIQPRARVLFGTYSKSLYTTAITCRTVVRGLCPRSAAAPRLRA